MHVFVAGGSGVVGRRLVPQLVARGHQVTATTTSPDKLGLLAELGAEGVVMDGLDASAVGEAVAKAEPDTIVHQMTGISEPHGGKPDMKHMDRWFAVTNRLGGGTCADVRAALDDRSLVRAPGLRGTIHLMAASDLGMWAGTFATMPPGNYPVDADEQPTQAEVDRLCQAIGDTVADTEPLTLEELHDGVVARAGSWAGDRVMPAFQGRWPRWRMVRQRRPDEGWCASAPREVGP